VRPLPGPPNGLMPTETVSFENHRGQRLAGRLELPRGQVRAWAVYAHCFTCSKDSLAAVHISRALATLGWGVLRFDFTGVGDSEGRFEDSHFSTNVLDIEDASRWLAGRGRSPAMLIGHSLGGAAALAAAGRIHSVNAAVSIAAPSVPAHVRHAFAEHIDEIREQGAAHVEIGSTGTYRITREFLSDIEAATLDDCVRTLRCALLVMHAPGDDVVGIEHASNLFRIARHPKSFVSLDDMDHLLTDADDANYVARVIDAWSSRYVRGQG
jgi:pimeloyl-ACP methyl ester carboxylesterase